MTFAERSTKKDSNESYNPEIGKSNMQNKCDNGDDNDCYTKILLAVWKSSKKKTRKEELYNDVGIKWKKRMTF